VFRTVLQKAVKVFASQVERNSLFEKPGERAFTPPLSATTAESGKTDAEVDQEDGESP